MRLGSPSACTVNLSLIGLPASRARPTRCPRNTHDIVTRSGEGHVIHARHLINASPVKSKVPVTHIFREIKLLLFSESPVGNTPSDNIQRTAEATRNGTAHRYTSRAWKFFDIFQQPPPRPSLSLSSSFQRHPFENFDTRQITVLPFYRVIPAAG